MPSQVGCCRDNRKEADNVEILVVDDHVLIREALRGVLKEVKGDATVLEASSWSKAMQVIAEHPDLDLIKNATQRLSNQHVIIDHQYFHVIGLLPIISTTADLG